MGGSKWQHLQNLFCRRSVGNHVHAARNLKREKLIGQIPILLQIAESKRRTAALAVRRHELPDLERKLGERFRQDPATPVYISGDADTRHADMVKALDAVRRIGFSKVAFNVKPTGNAPQPPASKAP